MRIGRTTNASRSCFKLCRSEHEKLYVARAVESYMRGHCTAASTTRLKALFVRANKEGDGSLCQGPVVLHCCHVFSVKATAVPNICVAGAFGHRQSMGHCMQAARAAWRREWQGRHRSAHALLGGFPARGEQHPCLQGTLLEP